MNFFSQLFAIGSDFLDSLLRLEDFFFTVRHFSTEGSLLQLYQQIFGDLGLNLPATDMSILQLLLGYGLPWLLTFKLAVFIADAFPMF